jgi:hypothetical protein
MGIEKSMVVLDLLRKIYKPRFTNKDIHMSKCKVVIGGLQIAMDTEIAMKVFELLNGTQLERVDYDYTPRDKSPTGKPLELYYLEPFGSQIRIEGIIAEDYAVWKLYSSTREEKK